MNGMVKATAAVAQSSALVQVLLWIIWQTTELVIPQEVSLNCVIGFSPVIYGVMSWIEKKTGVDVLANGEVKA